MKLTQLKCPSCGSNIEMDIQNRKAIFCPYCGSQFLIDDEVININQNIHIQDDAAIKREERLADESEREWVSRNSHSYLIAAILAVIFSSRVSFISTL